MDLPGYWIVLREHAVIEHPVGWRRLASRGDGSAAFAATEPLGIQEDFVFGAAFPRPTRSRVYASPLGYLTGARLAADLLATLWSGGTFTRWTMNRISGATECYLPF
jgi:hypothetical protein